MAAINIFFDTKDSAGLLGLFVVAGSCTSDTSNYSGAWTRELRPKCGKKMMIIIDLFIHLFIYLLSIFIILYIHIDVPMLFHYRLSLDHSIFFNVSILRFINTYYSNNVDTVVIHKFLTHTSTAYSI